MFQTHLKKTVAAAPTGGVSVKPVLAVLAIGVLLVFFFPLFGPSPYCPFL